MYVRGVLGALSSPGVKAARCPLVDTSGKRAAFKDSLNLLIAIVGFHVNRFGALLKQCNACAVVVGVIAAFFFIHADIPKVKRIAATTPAQSAAKSGGVIRVSLG
jgi:uncharacterized membrane protein